jgi:hypothetical protein
MNGAIPSTVMIAEFGMKFSIAELPARSLILAPFKVMLFLQVMP